MHSAWIGEHHSIRLESCPAPISCLPTLRQRQSASASLLR
jgi:hypothetical protein